MGCRKTPYMELKIDKEYAIQGKMLTAKVMVRELDMMSVYNTDAFKNTLGSQFARALIENRLLEFTKYQDVQTMNTVVHVRAFLVPDDQVRLLRTFK